MAKRIRNAVTMIMFMAIVLLLNKQEVFASELVSNGLVQYEIKLEQLNEELGTDYKMQPGIDSSYEEMVEYYTNMTMDEFESYIRNAYRTEQEMNEMMSKPLYEETAASIMANSTISPQSTLAKQRYFYDGSNYLYITAYTTTVNSSTIYTGDFGESGWYIREYPAYQPTSCTYSFSTDKKYLTCSWTCVKYVSTNLIATGHYTLSCSFTAGGGDIYPMV